MITVQSIGVIGAGTMGTGIAKIQALAGLAVVMVDFDEERVGRACDLVIANSANAPRPRFRSCP